MKTLNCALDVCEAFPGALQVCDAVDSWMFAVGAAERQEADYKTIPMIASSCDAEQVEMIASKLESEITPDSLFNFSSADLERLANSLCHSPAAVMPLHVDLMDRLMPPAKKKDLCCRIACQAAYLDNFPVLQFLLGGPLPRVLRPLDAPHLLMCTASRASVETLQ